MGVTVTYANNNQLKYKVELVAPGIVEVFESLPPGSTKRTERMWQWIREHMPMAIFIPPSYGVVREEELRSQVVVNRLVGSGDRSHVVRNLVVDLDATQLQGLNHFLEELTGTTICSRTSADRKQSDWPLRVEFKDSNGAIEVSAAGAGLVNLIALYSSLIRWRLEATRRDVVFLLDEPEAHLHPRLQASTALALSTLIYNEFGAQLIMATHSVDIINALGTRPATNIVRTDRTKLPACQEIISFGDLLSDISSWVDLEPYSALNFLASRKLYFHEGPSDAKILIQCAALLFRNRLADRDTFKEWAPVPLDGSGNRDVPALLIKLMKSPALYHLPTPSFQAITILDKDYGREAQPPETREKDGIKVIYRELVWSRHSIESLFVEESVLLEWLKALSIQSADLHEVLKNAILAANHDENLQRSAEKRMLPGLLDCEHSGDMNQRMAHAYDLSTNLAKENPEIWQRGKDRAAFVLRKIREALDHAGRRQFRTDMADFLGSVDVFKITNPEKAVPREIRELLESMV